MVQQETQLIQVEQLLQQVELYTQKDILQQVARLLLLGLI